MSLLSEGKIFLTPGSVPGGPGSKVSAIKPRLTDLSNNIRCTKDDNTLVTYDKRVTNAGVGNGIYLKNNQPGKETDREHRGLINHAGSLVPGLTSRPNDKQKTTTKETTLHSYKGNSGPTNGINNPQSRNNIYEMTSKNAAQLKGAFNVGGRQMDKHDASETYSNLEAREHTHYSYDKNTIFNASKTQNVIQKHMGVANINSQVSTITDKRLNANTVNYLHNNPYFVLSKSGATGAPLINVDSNSIHYNKELQTKQNRNINMFNNNVPKYTKYDTNTNWCNMQNPLVN